ncbi:MAG: V-type ATP synthase subunit K [Methanosarcinales archaeon]|jgi:V/A-type H+-transporting ATPase subunit K|nr:V-type ATP synthase subunit K [Methanosarcinales archaeon]
MEISTEGIVALSKAIAIVGTGLATAWAVKSIGTAGVGAMVENEAVFGKALVLAVLPETIVIFGLVVAILI